MHIIRMGVRISAADAANERLRKEIETTLLRPYELQDASGYEGFAPGDHILFAGEKLFLKTDLQGARVDSTMFAQICNEHWSWGSALTSLCERTGVRINRADLGLYVYRRLER